MNLLRGIVKKPENHWVICDMDGTLSDHTHRVHHVVGQSTDEAWEKYHAEMHLDDPHHAEQVLLRMFYRLGFKIAICTAREGIYKEQTTDWLMKHHINFNEIYMRPKGDYRPGAEIKEEIYKEHLQDKNILFVLEDRESVVDMWRRNGLTCFQCRPGNVYP